MRPEQPFLPLNIHTTWALLAARRGLIHDDRVLARRLSERSQQLLDEGDALLPVQARAELTSILYGLRLDGVTG
jgi:hypothetical protein